MKPKTILVVGASVATIATVAIVVLKNTPQAKALKIARKLR